jgi:hypothetical protein
MSIPLKTDDPAYWMLQKGIKEMADPNNTWVSKVTDSIYRETCYICNDHEFALMGMPLCYPCPQCKGHTPADDVECENGHVLFEYDLD